jgi:hypothetical protein
MLRMYQKQIDVMYAKIKVLPPSLSSRSLSLSLSRTHRQTSRRTISRSSAAKEQASSIWDTVRALIILLVDVTV